MAVVCGGFRGCDGLRYADGPVGDGGGQWARQCVVQHRGFGTDTEATVAMLEAIDAEFKRRNAIKAGKPDTGHKLIGRA